MDVEPRVQRALEDNERMALRRLHENHVIRELAAMLERELPESVEHINWYGIAASFSGGSTFVTCDGWGDSFREKMQNIHKLRRVLGVGRVARTVTEYGSVYWSGHGNSYSLHVSLPAEGGLPENCKLIEEKVWQPGKYETRYKTECTPSNAARTAGEAS
jgi:hypothetical protein